MAWSARSSPTPAKFERRDRSLGLAALLAQNRPLDGFAGINVDRFAMVARRDRLSDLCPQLLRQQWRRTGRFRRVDRKTRLHRFAGRGCDLAVADPSLAQPRLGL